MEYRDELKELLSDMKEVLDKMEKDLDNVEVTREQCNTIHMISALLLRELCTILAQKNK